ncbi:MAG: peptidylprolyl isomerase [Persicimonas sp.]
MAPASTARFRPWLVAVGCAVSLLAGGGCDGVDTPHEDPQETFSRLDEASDGEVAARVGDRSLSVDEFEAFWKQRPTASREEALEAFVERELLVLEGIHEQTTDWSSLATPRKRAMVRALFEEKVEDEITVDDLSDEDVADEVKKVERQLGHPPGVRASHLLVRVPKKQKDEATESTRDEWDKLQREWAERIGEELPDEVTALDLHEAREELESELPEPLEVTVESHLILPFDGDEYGKDLPSGWTPVVPAFRDAAVEMARQERFGEPSEPVETKFGWHLIVAEEVFEAVVPDKEQVREVAKDRLVRQRRTERTTELLEEWLEPASIEMYPELLEEEASLEK